LQDLDIETVVEQEKAAEEAHELAQQEKADAEAAGQTVQGKDMSAITQNAIAAAMGSVNGMLDKAAGSYAQQAKDDEEKRKNVSKKAINKINDEVDLDLEKSKLMN